MEIILFSWPSFNHKIFILVNIKNKKREPGVRNQEPEETNVLRNIKLKFRKAFVSSGSRLLAPGSLYVSCAGAASFVLS